MNSSRSALVLPIVAAFLGVALALALPTRDAPMPTLSILVDGPRPGVEFAVVSGTDFADGAAAYTTPQTFRVEEAHLHAVFLALDGESRLHVRVSEDPYTQRGCRRSSSGSATIMVGVDVETCRARSGGRADETDARPAVRMVNFDLAAVRVQFGGMPDCIDSDIALLTLKGEPAEARARCGTRVKAAP